jgi:hypothetical protein
MSNPPVAFFFFFFFFHHRNQTKLEEAAAPSVVGCNGGRLRSKGAGEEASGDGDGGARD